MRAVLIIAAVFATALLPRAASAQVTERYDRGVVTEVVQRGQSSEDPTVSTTDRLKVKLETGDKKGQVVDVEVLRSSQREYLQVDAGDRVVLAYEPNLDTYYVANIYRLPGLWWLFGAFALLVLAVGRLRGLTSLIGLGLSVVVIVVFLVPAILDGRNPLGASLLAALVILTTTLYLAHGFKRSTTVALVSAAGTLGIATLLALLAVNVASLFGLGSEEASYVQLSSLQFIDPRGLLLGGVLLGALGVLDDITIGQAVAVAELKAAQPALTFRQLYARAIRIGRHHVASLVNTLFLAYAGASLPLFLLFSEFQTNPLWAVINSDPVAEEILRTLVGSAALVLAVPITTLLAAWAQTRTKRAS